MKVNESSNEQEGIFSFRKMEKKREFPVDIEVAETYSAKTRNVKFKIPETEMIEMIQMILK